ncbi:MAG: hypothetical protein U5N26_07000 [Candidatus Marinimicrobia bacterium]|nr:hypothetical protein [Candidatus Neomarinimicrobiota bacterium]
MNDPLALTPNLIFWLLTTLIGVIMVIIGAVYGNMQKKLEAVEDELNNFKSCTDTRIETIMLDLTKVSEKVISKNELKTVIEESVTKQFLKWENRLLNDGRLKPNKKGE